MKGARMRVQFSDQRGSIPEWVMLLVMGIGIVMALWAVVQPDLTAIVTDALDKVPRVESTARGDAGATMIEFLAVTILTVVCLLAVVQMAVWVWARNVAVSAVHEGARTAAETVGRSMTVSCALDPSCRTGSVPAAEASTWRSPRSVTPWRCAPAGPRR